MIYLSVSKVLLLSPDYEFISALNSAKVKNIVHLCEPSAKVTKVLNERYSDKYFELN